MKILFTFIFVLFGFISNLFFIWDIFIPIWVSVATFVGVSIYLVNRYLNKRVGMLMLFLWLVYSLPFIHLLPYLWFDFDHESPSVLWGLAVNPYMLDEQVIKLTAMIGMVGGLGFSFGVSLNNSRISRDNKFNCSCVRYKAKTLSMPIWTLWVIVGVALSWLAAPQDSLFSSVYTQSESVLQNANFNSAWLMSYVFLSFALCDAIMDCNPVRKLLKRQLIFWSIAFVVVYLQLLRGDREVIPFVFAVFLVYFYWASPVIKGRYTSLPWNKIIIGGFVLIFLSMVLGAIRHSLADINNMGEFFIVFSELFESEKIGISNMLHGTWSAVLLTPLSVAGDYVHGLLSFKLGKTYLDLFLSMPPGFIADAIGYIRPIDTIAGPAQDMRYGMGGTHATVIAFMNFQIYGVFIFTAFWSYLLARVEKRGLRQMNVKNLSLLCTVVMVSPHWLWYGEKIGINALIIWFILAILYSISLLMSSWRSLFSYLHTKNIKA